MEERTILVAAAASDEAATSAVRLGAFLAELRGAQLVIGGIQPEPLGPGAGVYERAVAAKLERDLDTLVAHAGSTVTASVLVRGAMSIPHGLHDLCEELGAELLVVGRSMAGTVKRVLRGNMVLAILHEAPCPVVVAGEARGGDEPHAGDVVVGIDGSAESEAAIGLGAELAREMGTALRLVHVIENPFPFVPMGATEAGLDRWETMADREARELIERAAELVADDIEVSGEVREGLAADELARAARSAAFAVAGSRAHGPLKRLVLGSVAAALVRHAEVPVLIAPRGLEVGRPAAPSQVR